MSTACSIARTTRARRDIDGAAVPAVLLSGDHAAVARWRRKQALGRTWLRRPDLLTLRDLNEAEADLLEEEFKREQALGKT